MGFLDKHHQLYNSGYDYPYNRINEEGSCILWHYKDSERKYKSGLIAVPIINTKETYNLVFKKSDEKKKIADEIVEEYRNSL